MSFIMNLTVLMFILIFVVVVVDGAGFQVGMQTS